MQKRSADEEIELLMKAGFQVISIVSHEEARVLRCLEKVVTHLRDFERPQYEAEVAGSRDAEKALGSLLAQRLQLIRWTVTDGPLHWWSGNQVDSYQPLPLAKSWMRNVNGHPPNPTNPVDVLVSLRSVLENLIGYADGAKGEGVDLSRSVWAFCDLHHWLDRGDTAARFNHVLVRALRDLVFMANGGKRLPIIVFISPRNVVPMELEKEVQVIDYPLPTVDELKHRFDEQRSRFEQKYGAHNIKLSPDGVSRLIQALRGLTFSEADSVLEKSLANNGMLEASDIAEALREKEQIVKKDGMLEFVASETGMGDVGGLKKMGKWLEPRRRGFIQDNIEVQGRKIKLPTPKGMLMIGVPGGGKSLVAKAVAKEWGLPLLRLDIGRIFGGLVGQSEENMRRAIRIANSMAPCVLWLDEVEKAFPKTSGAGDSGTSLRVFNTFLTWLQEKKEPVFVVATGNDINGVPPELTRKGRFDEIFYVGLPMRETRKEIVRIHAKRQGIPLTEGDVNALAVASMYFTGAEIEQCVKDSAYHLADVDAEDTGQLSVFGSAIKSVMEGIVPLVRREGADGRNVVAETLAQARLLAVPADDFEDLPQPVAQQGHAQGAAPGAGWVRQARR